MANEFYQKMQEAKLRKAEAKAKQEENKYEKGKIHNETQRIRNQKQLRVQNKHRENLVKKVAKVFGYKKTLSSNLMKEFTPGQQTQRQSHAGRPQGNLKHISPITGKPIFAQQYYKEMRFVRRQNEVLADKSNQQRNIQMARQGIPPQQINQINMQRQMMQQQMSQRPNQPMNNQIQQLTPQNQETLQRQSIWNRQGYISQEPDIMGNMKQKIYGRPESFFN